MKHNITWLAVGLLAWTLTGCEDIPAVSNEGKFLDPQQGQGLVRASSSPIPDLPIPVGFTPLAQSSRSYAVPGGRFVEHHYQGRSSLSAAAEFYRQAMLSQDWRLSWERNDEPRVWVAQAVKGREVLDLRLTKPRTIVNVYVRIMNPSLGDPSTLRVSP